jgi:methionyl-tRNA formyltransferase
VPPWMLTLPRFGNINLHGSLLPKYRGAAPIQWAIAQGESVSGVTTMLLNEGLDTGDILLQRELAIASDDTAITYGYRLAAIGADLMVETMRALEQGRIEPREQDDSAATLAPILQKENGCADFTQSASRVYDRLRGFQPWPGCFTTFREKKLSFIAASPSPAANQHVPGELVIDGNRLFVACKHSFLELLEVQPEGKRKMSAGDFVRGYRPKPGERVGA